MKVESGLDTKQQLIAAWVAALVFVFPIPGTIALRNLLLLTGFLVLAWKARWKLPCTDPWLRPVAWCLLALTAWIVFHSVTIALKPSLALDQLRANWLNHLLVAGLAAWATTQLPRHHFIQAIVAGLAAHMIWLLGWQFNIWLGAGYWPFKATPFAAYDYQGTLNSFLLALLVVDRLVWLLEKYSLLTLGRAPGWTLLLLSVAADVALQSRNSTLVDVSLLLVAGVILMAAWTSHWRFGIAASGLVLLLGIATLSFDSRWQGLAESVSIGWSSPSTFWLTGDEQTRPLTPSGARLEESAYLRVAWAHQAFDMIAEHPLGIGFGHEAFGRAVEMKYGYPGYGSSHSGWLDFALGTGLPGLALLLLTAGLAIRGGWRQFRLHNDGVGLMFSFFVGGYLLRILLDGHFSGWRLGLFAFICGVLIASMKSTRNVK